MYREITTDVYDITIANMNGGRYRVFLFDGDTPTLVDAGLADTTDILIEQLADLDIMPERLVVTHGDGDHVGGAPEIADEYSLETWFPEGMTVDGHTPDHQYGGGDTIGSFTTVHTPGHAPEHHSLVNEATSVAVLGDAVFGADARGLPAGYFVLPTGFFSEDLNIADESLAALLDYEFDIGLVYHGSSVTKDAREKLRKFVEFNGKPAESR